MKILMTMLLGSIMFLPPSLRAVEHHYSLILAEYGEDSAGKQTQTLVRYRFNAGRMVSRESLLTTKTRELRYDLGRNQIYRNKFLVTMWGDVIDLASGRILWKSDGELVTIDPDSNSVIIRVNRETARGIFAFDLNSFQYREIQKPGIWGMSGVMSPDRRLIADTMTAEAVLRDGELRVDSDRLRVRQADGKELFQNNGFRRENDFTCNDDPNRTTFLWLDNEHLLTQRGNGNLVRVHIRGGVEPLMTIPEVNTLICGPELLRDADQNIYYDDRDHAWLVHIGSSPAERKGSFEPYLWQGDGNGFQSEYQQDSGRGRDITYNGVKIGQWWSDSMITVPGHIALIFGREGSNLGYPEGVKVWSVESGEWTTIKPKWLTALIGWVED